MEKRVGTNERANDVFHRYSDLPYQIESHMFQLKLLFFLVETIDLTTLLNEQVCILYMNLDAAYIIMKFKYYTFVW